MPKDESKSIGGFRPSRQEPPLEAPLPDTFCKVCGAPTPRSTGRPYCLNHSPYIIKILRKIKSNLGLLDD